eukprot:m.71683 g.71683  ORF g.71683 m.71683 type:complete len:692 (+) comp7961_c0_seq3:27-2102(+)
MAASRALLLVAVTAALAVLGGASLITIPWGDPDLTSLQVRVGDVLQFENIRDKAHTVTSRACLKCTDQCTGDFHRHVRGREAVNITMKTAGTFFAGSLFSDRVHIRIEVSDSEDAECPDGTMRVNACVDSPGLRAGSCGDLKSAADCLESGSCKWMPCVEKSCEARAAVLQDTVSDNCFLQADKIPLCSSEFQSPGCAWTGARCKRAPWRKCSDNECPDGQTCQECEGSPTCLPILAPGDTCAISEDACAPSCDEEHKCRALDETTPESGICCPRLGQCLSKCPVGTARVTAANGCPTCDCEPIACFGADPLQAADGSLVPCSRDGTDCGDQAFCDSTHAICCAVSGCNGRSDWSEQRCLLGGSGFVKLDLTCSDEGPFLNDAAVKECPPTPKCASNEILMASAGNNECCPVETCVGCQGRDRWSKRSCMPDGKGNVKASLECVDGLPTIVEELVSSCPAVQCPDGEAPMEIMPARPAKGMCCPVTQCAACGVSVTRCTDSGLMQGTINCLDGVALGEQWTNIPCPALDCDDIVEPDTSRGECCPRCAAEFKVPCRSFEFPDGKPCKCSLGTGVNHCHKCDFVKERTHAVCTGCQNKRALHEGRCVKKCPHGFVMTGFGARGRECQPSPFECNADNDKCKCHAKDCTHCTIDESGAVCHACGNGKVLFPNGKCRKPAKCEAPLAVQDGKCQ